MIINILDNTLVFPDTGQALQDPNGLLAVGGDLSPQRLLAAYANGIFPWFSEDEPIMWWSPDPRAILVPSQFHISRSFKKFLSKNNYQITLDHDFLSVISACSLVHSETWITPAMVEAYYQLHQLGVAHSIEVWSDQQLVGGVYGLAQGTIFCGESMFSLQVNASKVALYALCRHFIKYGGQLIDCQVLNQHTASLGAVEVRRSDYLLYLKKLKLQHLSPNCWVKQQLFRDGLFGE